jgi:ubiquinone/menaquinone biosynthesis C-methylase UbiE
MDERSHREPDARIDNQTYYDVMAGGYERHRHQGYHLFLDQSEVAAVADLVQGQDVLEVGCGTGLILQRLAALARTARGVDLSAGMLEQARARGLDVVQADATRLPFGDASFDTVVSFKVMAHVEDIRAAMAEIARVVRPGGYVAVEFYNRHSIRSLIKALKRPDPIGDGVHDDAVYTRYDSPSEALSYLPDNLTVERIVGIRTVVPFATIMNVPVIGPLLAWKDRWVGRTFLGRLGGFLVVIARKAPCSKASR